MSKSKKSKKEKKFKVFTPNPHFTGNRNGVQFTKGEGEATEEQLPDLIKIYGYYVPEVDEEKNKPARFEDEKAITDSTDEQTEEEETTEGSEELPDRPKKSATNEELMDFMKANGIEFESDNNKDTLNDKIDAWYESQKEAGSSK